MVRGLILATAVSLCLSSHCAADAVRKVHVYDPAAEAKKDFQAKAERFDEAAKLMRLTLELKHKYRGIWYKHRRETDQDARKQLQLQLDVLNDQIHQLQEATTALLK